MTTPLVLIDSIDDLRERWPEWEFELEDHSHGITIYATGPTAMSVTGTTEADAASWLDRRLTAAGYEAKGE